MYMFNGVISDPSERKIQDLKQATFRRRKSREALITDVFAPTKPQILQLWTMELKGKCAVNERKQISMRFPVRDYKLTEIASSVAFPIRKLPSSSIALRSNSFNRVEPLFWLAIVSKKAHK